MRSSGAGTGCGRPSGCTAFEREYSEVTALRRCCACRSPTRSRKPDCTRPISRSVRLHQSTSIRQPYLL